MDRRRVLTVLALGSLLVIAVVDGVVLPHTESRPVEGVADELAHAATALLLVGMFNPSVVRKLGLAVVLGGVLIDADHVPMEFFGWDVLTRGTHRPYSHSLFGLLVAMVVAMLFRRRPRSVAWAMVWGFTTHLVRDMVTGGVPLLWPLTKADARLSYPVYALLLGASVSVLARREYRPLGADYRDVLVK